jgi:hypothetical protein
MPERQHPVLPKTQIDKTHHNPKRGQGKPSKSKDRNLAKTCVVVQKLGGVALFPHQKETSPATSFFFFHVHYNSTLARE